MIIVDLVEASTAISSAVISGMSLLDTVDRIVMGMFKPVGRAEKELEIGLEIERESETIAVPMI